MRLSSIYLLFFLLMPSTAKANPADDDIVRIAVLDTGSRIPDNYPNVSVRYFDARPRLDAIVETGPEFRSEHGTWVTNAILEKYTGPVEILSYRVEKICHEEIRCEIDTASLGRAAMHARLQGADIIQISSYGRIGPVLEGILGSIADKGIHVVMSAGNEGGVSLLLPLARRNPEYIHIVGSLNERDRRSFFSARDERRDEPLLRWRLGEDVSSRSARGHRRHVTGTSYSASIMTADLARSIAQTHSTTLAAYDPVRHGQKPAPTHLEETISQQEDSPIATVIMQEERIATRVALAEGGEIPVAILDPVEKARLRSRAIRPPENTLTAASSVSSSYPLAASTPAALDNTRRSRAVRPDN